MHLSKELIQELLFQVFLNKIFVLRMSVIMMADLHHWWKYHQIQQHSSFVTLSKLFSTDSTGQTFILSY